jgi:glycosyltransferase involved in cell wall biosynthesis
MSPRRLRVLTISELFPDPARPAFGVFVAHQVQHLQAQTEQVVVVPSRVFPPLRLWRNARLADWRRWCSGITQLPVRAEAYGAPVFYPRYTSPPRQLAYGSWGFFAYAALRSLLFALHREYRFDLIHAHYASPSGVIALLARRFMQVPIVLSVHGADVTFGVEHDALSRAVVRWVFGNVDAIAVNSTWTAERVIRHGGNPSKVQVVSLGADPPPDLRVVPRAEGAPLRLLSVGYLEERKGHAFVLRALASLRRLGYAFRYSIVGEGPRLAELQSLASALGLADWVSFEGSKPHAAVWSDFAQCDIFVLPSWLEAFGVVYIEALSLAKPVIACHGEGGPEDLKRLGDCVELVEPRDVVSLTQALRRLMDDPARRQRFGETGREIVRTHYTWQRNAEQTLAVYRRALAARSKATS